MYRCGVGEDLIAHTHTHTHGTPDKDVELF